MFGFAVFQPFDRAYPTTDIQSYCDTIHGYRYRKKKKVRSSVVTYRVMPTIVLIDLFSKGSYDKSIERTVTLRSSFTCSDIFTIVFVKGNENVIELPLTTFHIMKEDFYVFYMHVC